MGTGVGMGVGVDVGIGVGVGVGMGGLGTAGFNVVVVGAVVGSGQSSSMATLSRIKSFPPFAVLDEATRSTTDLVLRATLWVPVRVKKAHTPGEPTPLGPVNARIGGPIDTHANDEVNGLQLLAPVFSQISKDMFMLKVVYTEEIFAVAR
jgi:hypothetical protein